MSRRVLGFGLLAFAGSALVWFALRAYTGIFSILNLRVFIGVVVLLPPWMVALTEAKANRSFVLGLFASVLGVGAVIAGEALAGAVTGRPMDLWERFTAGMLVAAAVVPFAVRKMI